MAETVRRSITDAAAQLAAYNAEDLHLAEHLREMIMQTLQDGRRRLTACDIRQLAGAAESTQKVARLALGASTSNEVPVKPAELPEIDFQKLSSAEWEEFNRLLYKCGVLLPKSVTPGGGSIQ